MRKIALVGDIHGSETALYNAHGIAVAAGCEAIIQVGDFGVWEWTQSRFKDVAQDFEMPVFFINGNHEDYNIISTFPANAIHQWVKNCYYVPRGMVLEIAGARVGFLGGAASIDRKFRTAGKDWFSNEVVTVDDCLRLAESVHTAKGIDLLITHTPPQWLVNKHFEGQPYGNPFDKVKDYSVPVDWKDPSAELIDVMSRKFNHPPLVCGHFHKYIVDRNVTVLDIDQVIIWDSNI